MKKITLFLAALTISFSAISADMSGKYLIGTDQTYVTLGAAITDINAATITGDIILEITSDISETAPITLTATNSANTITIKPAASTTPTITFSGCVSTSGANQYTGFAVNNTSNIIIDGSNTTNGATKDLTFKMNDATNGRNIIQLYGNCDNVSIKNLNIIFQSPMSTSTSTRAIYLNGQSSGACDNFIVENCNIGDASQTPFYGVGVTGSSGSSIYCTNVQIKNNNVYGRIRPVYLYYVGTTGTSTYVTDNSIYTLGGANGTTTYTIMWNTWAGTLNIKNNKIPTITVANTSGTSGVYGISGLTSATGAIVNIQNNFIGGINGSTGVAIPSVFALMYLQDNATYNIYNNTIYYQSLTNVSEKSCIHISGTSCTVNLKNNLIVNNTDNATAYCIWKSNGTLISDNNAFFAAGTNSNIGYLTSAKKTLADWQTAFTPNNDLNSKVATSIEFVDAATGNLSLTGTSVQDGNLAVPRLNEVMYDIFGTLRDADTYAGAHQSTSFIPTETINPVETVSILRTRSGIAINLDNESTVEIYSINGIRIENTVAYGLYTHDLNAGVYIVKINGKSQKFIK